MFYQNYLAMSETADDRRQISGAIYSLIVFYDIHGRKRKVLFFYFVADTTRDDTNKIKYKICIKNKRKNIFLKFEHTQRGCLFTIGTEI
jgi:hypothetical protein